jgi:endonuclease/exonuclease/phosphatase family metal-dependent hydrolase
MRVITWNMGLATGGTERNRSHEQAWHFLLGLGPDIAFVQESLPPAWVRSAGSVIHGPFTKWGSAVFSPRYPLERVLVGPDTNLHALGSYVAMARASLPDGTEAFVASVHARAAAAAPAHLKGLDEDEVTRPAIGHPRVTDTVAAGLDKLRTDRFILAGDWNTARVQGSVKKDRAGAQFFERASERGWYDCVHEQLGEELRTWFGKGRHLKQDDHVFCDATLGRTSRDPWVATRAATLLGLSDHAPLVVDFKMKPIAMSSLSEEEAPT